MMSVRRVVSWALALLVLLGAAAWAKGKSKRKSKPDVVSMAFGWPSDRGAQVSYKWTRTGPGNPAEAISLAARLTVATEGELLRVGYRDWRAEPALSPMPPGASLPSFEKMATIVDKKGALVRVDGSITAADAQ